MAAGVILYDGECILCSRSAQFVIARDRKAFFKFMPMQGAEGRALAKSLGIDANAPDSFAAVIDAVAHVKSDGVLAVLERLPGWGWSRILRAVPRGVRDWCYDWIAGNRYRLFGRAAQCIMPDPKILDRFAGLPVSKPRE